MKFETSEVVDMLDKKEEHIQFLYGEIARLQTENSDLRLTKFKKFNNDECWIYQGDGEDHLESLTCPVVINAKVLMELIKNQKSS